MFNTWAVVILYSSMLLIIAVCVCLTLYTLRPVGVEGFSDDKSSIEFNSCKLLRRYIKMGKKEALERAILNVQSVITGWQMRSIWEPAIHQTGAYVLNIFFHTWSSVLWWGKFIIICTACNKRLFTTICWLKTQSSYCDAPIPPCQDFPSWSEVLNRSQQNEKQINILPPYINKI